VCNSYAQSNSQPVNQFNVDIPDVIIQHIPADIIITIAAFKNHSADTVDIRINKKLSTVIFKNGHYKFDYQFVNNEELTISIGSQYFSRNIMPVRIDGWLGNHYILSGYCILEGHIFWIICHN
jgi:hypothetical protein